MRAAIAVVSMAAVVASASAQPVAPPPSAPTTSPSTEPTAEPPAPTPTPLAPSPVADPQIQRATNVASRLARDGHCDAALDYGREIEAEAPAYYAQVFIADRYIAACIAGTAPSPSLPAATVTATEESDPELDHEPCQPIAFYAAPSLFTMSGSTYTDPAGSTMHTSNEDTFHRVAVGGRLRSCTQLRRFGARLGATAVLNPVVAGFGVEAEIDYGASRSLRGGLRIGVEVGSDSRIVSAGPRVHVFDTLFVGVDAYAARSEAYTSRGVMFGFGLEGRAGRWAVAIEGALVALGFAIFFIGGGPP